MKTRAAEKLPLQCELVCQKSELRSPGRNNYIFVLTVMDPQVNIFMHVASTTLEIQHEIFLPAIGQDPETVRFISRIPATCPEQNLELPGPLASPEEQAPILRFQENRRTRYSCGDFARW